MNSGFRKGVLATGSWLAFSLAQAAAQAQPVLQTGEEALVLDTITVTPTRTEGRVVDQLAGASAVTRETIDQIQPNRVSDVLRTVPGVTTQENANSPATAVNIRGLQNFGRVVVTVDGARQNFQQTGHSASGTFFLDPEFISRVDVVRGPVSTIYGSGAIGGVAAFRTRTIDDILQPDDRFGVEQKVGVGSNGSGFLTSTSVGARIGTAGDMFGQFVFRDRGQYKDGSGTKIPDSGNELIGGLFKANVRPGDGHTLSFGAQLQDFQFTNNGTSATGTRFSHDVRTETFSVGYRFNRPDVPLLDLTANVYRTSTRDEQRVVLPTATYRALGVRTGDPLTYDIGTTGFDIFNTSRFSTGRIDHALTYGVDGVFDEVTTTDQAGGYGSAFTPLGERRLLGGFIQDEARFGGWLRVIGALRFDSYELEGGTVESSGERLSPKLTVGVTPIRGIELYATYAEAYRAPALSETLINGIHPFPPFRIRPNPNLRPETARSLEGGVNLSYDAVFSPGDALRGKLTIFTSRVEDYIEQVSLPGTVPFQTCPSRFCPTVFLPDVQFQNISKAKLDGIEAEATYDWGAGFVTVAGSAIDGKNEVTGATLVTVPPNKVAATLGFRMLDRKLTFGVRGLLVDEKDVTVGSTILPSKAYGLVDLFASYRVNDRVSGDLVIENLLDRRYRKYLDSENGQGLTAKLALTVKFTTK